MRGEVHSEFVCRLLSLVSLVLVLFGLVSCSPPKYDAQTDKLITTLQTDTDTLLINLISLDNQIHFLRNHANKSSNNARLSDMEKSSYRANISSYNKINVDYVTLRTRIDATQNKSTPHLDRALDQIYANLFGKESLETQHQKNERLERPYLESEKAFLDSQFAALLTYELVLKDGVSP